LKFLPGEIARRKTKKTAASDSEDNSMIPPEQMEKVFILRVYNRLNNNKSKTARTLGIGLNTLRRKLESYGVK